MSDTLKFPVIESGLIGDHTLMLLTRMGSVAALHYLGIDPTKSPYPKKIYIDEERKTVTVVWNDGKQNKSTCDLADNFDPLVGFAMCLLKRTYGKDRALDLIRKKGKKATHKQVTQKPQESHDDVPF